jgi:hypothetical protein
MTVDAIMEDAYASISGRQPWELVVKKVNDIF